MSDLAKMLPIYLFMLIPVWIPLATMACGALVDAIKAPAKVGARTAAPAGRRTTALAPANATS